MKTILLPLLFLAAANIPNLALGQNIEQEFETILNKVRRSYGIDHRDEDYMLTWSGLNTEEGIRFCVNNQIHFQIGDNSERASLSRLYLKNTTVPDKTVTTMIREEATAASEADDMWALSRSFSLLSNYPLEDETIRFLAGFFADDRVIETRERKPEAYYGHPLRVSDRASGFLRGLLEREKRWGPDDPTYYGHPNDAMEWKTRDELKDALNAYLLREGLIEKAMPPAHEQWTPPARKPPVHPAPIRNPKPRREESESWIAKDGNGAAHHLSYWLIAGMLLGGAGIFFYARIRASGHQ